MIPKNEVLHAFLEAAREGRWAFLWPALLQHKDEVLALIAEGGALGGK